MTIWKSWILAPVQTPKSTHVQALKKEDKKSLNSATHLNLTNCASICSIVNQPAWRDSESFSAKVFNFPPVRIKNSGTYFIQLKHDIITRIINMIFYSLPSAGPQGRCCNLHLKGEGFNNPPAAGLHHKKHVWSLLLHRLNLLVFFKKGLRKIHFVVQIMDIKAWKMCRVLKTQVLE